MILVDREVVLAVIGGHEPLEGPFAERSVAQHGRWDHAESETFAQQVGRDLASVEARLEVPQRPFAACRLVDRRMRSTFADHVDEVRGIAAVGHATLDLDVTVEEVSNGIVDRIDAQLDAAFVGLVVVELVVIELVVGFIDVVGRRVGHGQFIRGQSWPSGSIGNAHHWHAGRPASTTASAWSQNAAACPRLR